MRKKLLLADDSITIQKVVELTFPSDEFEVVTAGNGRIAVDKAMTFLPDIVLCDVIMPQLDGYQVCEALRASPQLKSVPILLLNGAFEPYDAARAKAVGALGNVSKPFDPPALVARVKELLAEHSTAAFSRPSMDVIETVQEDAEAAATAPQEFEYDESEIHPVSTVEVPLDVRELAARSLSLDAPVFNASEPGVLTEEAEPSDFSETLHGPLDEKVEELPGIEPAAAETSATETVEAIEAVEEMEPVAPTGEFETPRHKEPADTEPVEFDSDTSMAEPLPGTLPPKSVPRAAAVEEFAGEHEFEPEELDAAAAKLPSVEVPAVEVPEAAATEPMELPEELAASEPMANADLDRSPASPPDPAIGLPAPAPKSAEPKVPAALPEPPMPKPAVAPVPPPPPPAPAAAAAPMPSAEVAVPMDMVQQIAQRVISQVSERVIREIAWDIIPGLAEKLVKAEIERIKSRAESERD